MSVKQNTKFYTEVMMASISFPALFVQTKKFSGDTAEQHHELWTELSVQAVRWNCATQATIVVGGMKM